MEQPKVLLDQAFRRSYGDLRILVVQLPKLDDAGSTPVARSLLSARPSRAFPRCVEMKQREVQSARLGFRSRRGDKPSPACDVA